MKKESDVPKADIDSKIKHQQLASVIKGVHKHLRRDFRENNQDIETVWKRHTKDETILERYASAMYQLATEHWSQYAETRIDWCQKTAVDYFINGGLKSALEKDLKKKYYMDLKAKNKVEDENECDIEKIQIHDKSFEPAEPVVFNHEASCGVKNIMLNNLTQGKIRLLDVGSCYNPFSGLEQFEAVGIDLSPANETVLKCDFLQLTTRLSIDPLLYDLNSLTSPLKQLPQESFHTIVFSLLLEYLPSPAQRWQCCVKAYELLSTNGLLLIITPDSHSQHRNAPMMKSWRLALEKLGFLRWKYEKKEHVHCMAYRKVTKYHDYLLQTDLSQIASMLYIPQDFTDACYDDLPQDITETYFDNLNQGRAVNTEMDTSDFLDAASELPFYT